LTKFQNVTSAKITVPHYDSTKLKWQRNSVENLKSVVSVKITVTHCDSGKSGTNPNMKDLQVEDKNVSYNR
jgi:hypothetical protein